MWLLLGLLVFLGSLCLRLSSRGRTERGQRSEALKRLPGFRPRPVLGNLQQYGFLKLRNRRSLISELYYTRLGVSSLFHEEGMYLVWLGRQPVLFLNTARTAEAVLSSKALIDKSTFYDALSHTIGTGLISSSGDKWRQDRKSVTPVFHVRFLEGFLGVMNEHSATLVDLLRRESGAKKWLDPQQLMNNCVLDILSDSIMDLPARAQTETSGFVSLFESIIYLNIKRMYSPWFHSDIYFLFPEGKRDWKLTQKLHKVVEQIIDKKISERQDSRRNGYEAKNHFMDILLEMQMPRKELRDQMITFISAGHHTVGAALCWLLYLLGLHQDVQSKLFDEVNLVFRGGKVEEVTKEHLNDLKYMNCVIKESQRLYPSVPDVARLISEDTMIGGYNVPKGTECVISIAAIHRDPDVYPEPERFDPERFLQNATIPQFAFIPFSAGPRNCIGQAYAQAKMKVILCHVISALRVHSLDPADKVLITPEIVSKPLEPFRMVFEPRDLSNIASQ